MCKLTIRCFKVTLDSWPRGEKCEVNPTKKQTEKELEAEIKRMRENSEKLKASKTNQSKMIPRFDIRLVVLIKIFMLWIDNLQEEMKKRAEEARKRKLDEKAREKERKKEEKKLLTEVLADWKKTRYLQIGP